MTIQELGLIVAKLRLRANRGNTWTNELKGLFLVFSGGGVILLLIDRYFGVLFPLWILPVFWVTQKIIEFIIGRIDEKYLKFWQIENEYLSRHTNPWNTELLDKVNQILKKVNER